MLSGSLYDPSSVDHVARLKTRKGLQIYQERYSGSTECWLTQQFDRNLAEDVNERNREWDGATQDGITTIRSGPDYNKVNATLVVPDGSDLAIKERLQSTTGQQSHPTNLYRSIFVGCFETEDEAATASDDLNQLLSQLASNDFSNGIHLEECREHIVQRWQYGKRTREELKLGLKPCGKCHTKFSTKKCSACKFQWYCCAEHQKDDWTRHKPICKAAKVQRKKKSKTVKAAKTTNRGKEMDGSKQINKEEMMMHLHAQLGQKCTTHPADELCNICDPDTPTYIYTVIGMIPTSETEFKVVHKLFKLAEKLTEAEVIAYVEKTNGNGRKFTGKPNVTCMRPPGQKAREQLRIQKATPPKN